MPSTTRHRLRMLLVAFALSLGATGCAASLYPDGVYVDAVPARIESYPYTYYGGRPTYYVDGRWYYRSGPSWYYYRSEPRHLYEYRGRAYRAAPAYRQPIYTRRGGYEHRDYERRQPRERVEIHRSAPSAHGEWSHHHEHSH